MADDKQVPTCGQGPDKAPGKRTFTISAKSLSLAGTALVLLGIVGVYSATMMAVRDNTVNTQLHRLLLSMVSLLTALLALVLYRGIRKVARRIGTQLTNMARSGQIGPVASEPGEALAAVTSSLNELLAAMQKQTEDVRAENRELSIQSRITAAEKKQAEAVISSISDAVLMTNRFGELVLANQAAEKLLGFTFESSFRKNIEQVVTDPSLAELIRQTHGCDRELPSRTVEHTIERQGESRTFNVTLNCILTDGDEPAGVAVVLHEVTRDKETAQMKTEFVANVSHEMKTPLASIKAYMEMLIDGEAQDARTQREFHEIIFSETERLSRLVDNILSISRIESGVATPLRERISLSAVVKQAMDVAAIQAKIKNIELIGRLAPVHYQVEADADLIYQATLNLLSNAIKYTPEGCSVRVGMAVDEGLGTIACTVADTGVGIPADELPYVFDKFYRGRANRLVGKGTGLGLTLTKRIIEDMHYGSISVTSEEGKGSTFAFELPISTTAPGRSLSSSEAAREEAAK